MIKYNVLKYVHVYIIMCSDWFHVAKLSQLVCQIYFVESRNVLGAWGGLQFTCIGAEVRGPAFHDRALFQISVKSENIYYDGPVTSILVK